MKVIEEYTVDKNTVKDIKSAIEKGKYLVVCNADQQLLNLVLPLIDWKTEHQNYEIVFNYFSRPDDFTYQRKIQFADEGEVYIHKEFRLMLINTKENFKFNLSIINKVIKI